METELFLFEKNLNFMKKFSLNYNGDNFLVDSHDLLKEKNTIKYCK